jgi:hypothetical protein
VSCVECRAFQRTVKRKRRYATSCIRRGATSCSLSGRDILHWSHSDILHWSRSDILHWSRSDILNLAVRFNARSTTSKTTSSRQRRMTSVVIQSSLTRRLLCVRSCRALKRTAKRKRRYATKDIYRDGIEGKRRHATNANVATRQRQTSRRDKGKRCDATKANVVTGQRQMSRRDR